MNAATNAETLALIKTAHGAPNAEIAKAWTQGGSATSGITAYDLEAPSKKLFPVLTPLRNATPRVSGKGGIQANWRAVTGINITKVSGAVSQGNRGAVVTTATADYTAAYKAIGLEDTVTFEADYSGEGFEDVKALATDNLLKAAMIEEEQWILGANNSLALGTTANATLTSSNTGGSLLGNTSYGVGVVALTFDGMRLASVPTGIVQSFTRTNADSSTDVIHGGSAAPSAQANVSTANTGANTATLNMSTTAILGAVAYAWFWGVASGNLTLGAITTINSYTATAAPAGVAVAPGVVNFNALTATDNSTDSLKFDGFLTFAFKAALGSYQQVMATGTAGTGSALTADGAGGVVEIENALKYFWDNYRLSPDEIWVSSQEMTNIGKKIMAGSTNGAMRINIDMTQGMIGGGIMVRSYLNKYSMSGGQEIPIKLHPNIPAGVIFFNTRSLPYPLSNVSNVAQMRMRREYYQIEWPQRSRKYEYGVYEDGVLQHFFPPSLGVICNIANG